MDTHFCNAAQSNRLGQCCDCHCGPPLAPTPKGEPMPQTLEAWREWGDGVEKAMLRDKAKYEAEIAKLKQTINKLRQRG